MKSSHALAAVLAALSLFVISGAARAQVDADAAQALAKKSKCTTCHAVDKKKDGPSFKETAAKYKGKPDAVDKLFKHVTTSPTIKVDGKEETHEDVKSKNEAEIRNLIGWILAQ